MELTADVRALIDDHIATFLDEHELPSVVAAVSCGPELVHVAAAAAPGQPVPSADTPFRIASMTKSFTAAAVLLLRDRGQLRLDDPVAALAPELVSLTGPTTDSPPVTVRHLLSMSGGLAGDDPWADRLLDAEEPTMEALLAGGASFALAPGSGFVYSNFGYAMLGRILTRIDGRPFQDLITTELLEPLGLGATGWHPPVAGGSRPEPARPWWRVEGELVEEPVLGDGGFAAMGGLWSTVADLARWCGWLLDGFPARDGADGPVLARASRREMQQVVTAWPPVITTDAAGTRILAGGYGNGLNVAVDSRLGPMVQHSGGLPGYGSNMRWLPDRGVAVVALANLRYAPARLATLGVLDLLAAQDALPPVYPLTPDPLAACAEGLVSLLNAWSDEQAAALFSFNVDLDEPLARRRAAAAERLAAAGPLAIRSVTALNRAEADVEVVDGQGAIATLSLMLAPEPSPRIQWYELTHPDGAGAGDHHEHRAPDEP
jgi:CubicO group peptidase (beta-lactamase class C family)